MYVGDTSLWPILLSIRHTAISLDSPIKRPKLNQIAFDYLLPSYKPAIIYFNI